MDELSATFAALADPTRRAILARLGQGQTHVGALAEPFAISAPAISRHLRVLESAGLIRREVDARRRVCRLQTPPLQAAHDWLEGYRLFWEHSLDRLVEVVEREQCGAPAPSLATRAGAARRKPTKPPQPIKTRAKHTRRAAAGAYPPKKPTRRTSP